MKVVAPITGFAFERVGDNQIQLHIQGRTDALFTLVLTDTLFDVLVYALADFVDSEPERKLVIMPESA